MATWKRFFNTPVGTPKMKSSGGSETVGLSNYSTGLKEVFTGPTNRLERYNQFDQLDRDPIINSALNIIAEFCTQENIFTKLPFYFNFHESTNDAETNVLRSNLNKWAYTNDFRKRMFYIIRNTLKYGDCFFIRDPETFEWLYVDPRNIEKVVVDETKGKKIHSYFVRNISLNLASKIASQDTKNAQANYTGLMPNTLAGRQTSGTLQSQQNTGAGESLEVPADHIVHLSLNSTGMDYINWPFSASILESIYKPAKQKELLENAFLIYTIQRAPERRVFYVYTGDAPSHKAMEFVERFKYELHQKRIPTRDGGGNSIIDGTYDPQCLAMDTVIPLLDGRKLSITDLTKDHNNGIQNWTYSIDPKTGEIMPGKISWAGITRKNAEVIKLTFDNGKELVLTPDHKIPVWGKGYVEAKDITRSDELFGTNGEKVVIESLENIDYKLDTGCITIDQDEEFHSNHNFAVDSGIFVKNSMTEDFFVPVNSEGQGPRIETLPGGDAMSSGVDNLKFFNNLITRGLGIPSSYIPTEGEDSQMTYNDGRTGVALLQEWRFAQHCKRLQALVRDTFDAEFKKYCDKRGTVINNGDFTLEFEEPQSFGEYRQMEKDSTQLNVLTTASSIEYLSKRFVLKRFGGLTEEEVNDNERMWKEENKGKIKGSLADVDDIHDLEDIDLNNVGVKKPVEDEEVDNEIK